MADQLPTVISPAALPVAGFEPDRFFKRFCEGRTDETLRAYQQDLQHFARWAGVRRAADAIGHLLSLGLGGANECAHAFRSAMIEQKLSPATVNRRLSALRSVVTLARQFGHVSWALEVANVNSESYRDTRGPGTKGVTDVIKHAAAQPSPTKAARDVAIIRLLYDCALRRKEVAGLDLADFEPKAARLRILGKGRRESEYVTLPTPTIRAIEAWIEERGTEPGPLFRNLDRAEKGTGLTGDGIYRIVRALGDECGVPHIRPHGVRHSAITEALDRSNGNVRAVQKFSRHRDVATVNKYDDNRTDMGGQIANLVAETLVEE